jgi:UDP-3-O-[3-hydroxymyristoyl] glucosamine N-acyltransferase
MDSMTLTKSEKKDHQKDHQQDSVGFALSDIAALLGARLTGADPACRVFGIGTLKNAKSTDISFFTNPIYRQYLQHSNAAAVIVSQKSVGESYAGPALWVDNPHEAMARVSALFFKSPQVAALGVHATAIVASDVVLGTDVCIGPFVVVGARTRIGAGVMVGAGCSIGEDCDIGPGTCLYPRVVLYQGVRLGARGIIHSGAVIGSDGFGFALSARHTWVKVYQLGGICLGDDVEVGANTTIDRGAVEDTQIGTGVKLDNQIQIAHNVLIGDHAIIAAQAGIAGSSEIGPRVAIGGQVGITGHLRLGAGVQITPGSTVMKSIEVPGVYTSGTGHVMPHAVWKRWLVYIRKISTLFKKQKANENEPSCDVRQ